MSQKDVKGYKEENYVMPTSRWAKTEKRAFFFQLIMYIVYVVSVSLVVMAQFAPEIDIFWKVVLMLTAGPIIGVSAWKFFEYMEKQNWFVPLSKSGIWIGEVGEEGILKSEMRITKGDLFSTCHTALEEIE